VKGAPGAAGSGTEGRILWRDSYARGGETSGTLSVAVDGDCGGTWLGCSQAVAVGDAEEDGDVVGLVGIVRGNVDQSFCVVRSKDDGISEGRRAMGLARRVAASCLLAHIASPSSNFTTSRPVLLELKRWPTNEPGLDCLRAKYASPPLSPRRALGLLLLPDLAAVRDRSRRRNGKANIIDGIDRIDIATVCHSGQ